MPTLLCLPSASGNAGRTFLRSAAVAVAMLGTVALTGCGIGTLNQGGSTTLVPAFEGKAFGGPNPIIGATVKMYATGNSSGGNDGYGVGTLLAEAVQKGTSAGQDTDQYGQFHFAGGYNCPAGQFAYMVASGGNTGANTVNNQSVLVAAMGRCEDLYNFTGGVYTGYKGSTIFMNELTTVAAAYALGHFSTVTGTGAATVVSIGAPATNNAAQVSGVSTGCIAGVGACTTTQAAGLAHAFQNAANLVNVFANAGIATGANANLTGTSAAAVVPQQLINALGNVLISCVNSTGGVAGDASNCGTMFTATTINSVAPTNTFSAMVNLAANPSLGGSAVACQSFLNLASPQTSVYAPAVSDTSTVHDLSIAINYPQALGAATTTSATCAAGPCQGIQYTQSGALDANDVFYFGNQDVSSGTKMNVGSISSNGTFLSISTDGNGSAGIKDAFGLSIDTVGGIYVSNGGGSGTKPTYRFTSSGGVVSSLGTLIPVGNNAYTTAVDRANNLWIAASGSGGNNLLMSSFANSSAATPVAPVSVTVPGGTFPTSKLIGLSVDPAQNIWLALGSTLTIIENTGTVAAPLYGGAKFITTLDATAPGGGIAFVGTPTAFTAYISSYQGTSVTTGVEVVVPTLTGAAVTGFTSHTLVSPASLTGSFYNEADGSGAVWIADTNSHSVLQFTPGATPTGYRLQPCLAATPGASSACATVFGANGKPTTVSIDSAGSIWVADGAGNNLVQIIGAAAPTWPLLSLGKTGQP